MDSIFVFLSDAISLRLKNYFPLIKIVNQYHNFLISESFRSRVKLIYLQIISEEKKALCGPSLLLFLKETISEFGSFH